MHFTRRLTDVLPNEIAEKYGNFGEEDDGGALDCQA